jgi:hypothetical protein
MTNKKSHTSGPINPKSNDEIAWEIHENHVYPISDLREHSLTDCWCAPVDDDGVMVHKSLDGCELFERGDRKMS